MSFGFFDFLSLIGALGLFIFGMKVMSDSIQKAAGSKLREILEAMTSRRIFGLFTGLLITTMVQSSSATTVMVVSFVNAGLINLVQSIGVIMGANIGTTVTGWLISELGLGRFNMASICLPIIAIGFPLLFSGREKLKLYGEVLVGFAILFLGLNFMKESVEGLRSEELFSFLKGFNYTDQGYFAQIGTVILFVLIGTALTIVVQSSSAAMALTLVMTNEGWISFPLAAAIILGENVGTTLTANLAALVGNVHAKRSARAHFVFNVLGVIWMLLVFPVFLAGVASAIEWFSGRDPFLQTEAIPSALALFHTAFNVVNVLLLIGFTGFIARIVIKMVPSKGIKDEEYSLDYIGSGLMETSELSIVEARRELVKFAQVVRRAFKYIPLLITEMDEKRLKDYDRQLQRHEETTDRMEMEIATYLGRVSKNELSTEAAYGVRTMVNIASYLERIGDIYVEISRGLGNRKKQKAYFTPHMRDRVLILSDMLSLALDQMVKNLSFDEREIDFQKARQIEEEIDKTYKKLRKEYIRKVEKGKFQLRSGIYYSDLISEMERIADLVAQVSDLLRKEKEAKATPE